MPSGGITTVIGAKSAALNTELKTEREKGNCGT